MQQRKKTYIYHENILSIPASLLYDDWKLMSYSNYKKKCERGQLVRSRPGKGKDSVALLSYHDLPEEIKAICIERLGDYRKAVRRNDLEEYIVPDSAAIRFFSKHRNPDGKELSKEKQLERATSCHILNAIKSFFKDKNFTSKSSKIKTKIWEEVSDAVNELDIDKWYHNLPTTAKNLKIRFSRYEKEGYSSFIHKGEGNERTIKIKGDVADYVLALYCLPIRLTVPEVLAKYNEVRLDNEWPSLTESAINIFLSKPENERVWTLARNGPEAYNRKYKHTIKRDKSRWFPNVYWAIDGTKLDLAYINPETKKTEAYKRINIVFDVYSEVILGWSFSETEAISDHFRAVKMAVQKAGVKPYLFTYDQQAGHKSQKMQDIYSAMVAEDGGTHYPHKARGHSSPAEGIIRRLQQQEITKLFNSDGLGVTTKTDQSHANQDFLAENLHKLPLKDDVIKQWEYIVMRWNNAKHYDKKAKTRNEVYAEEMLVSEPLELTEVMRMMWIEENKKPITYKANGIKIVVDKQEYDFEVYDMDGKIDLDFRRKHVGDKFIVRYDPDAMDGHIQLLKKNQDGEKYLVAYAEPKRSYEVVPKLMRDGEKEQNIQDMNVKMQEYEADLKAWRELEERTGITRERMIAEQELAIKMKNVNPKKINIKADREESLLSQW
ncbi:TPA: transposase family protein [Elizabethkingia anophelis]|nr:transposase family protein [Elizabethkingia anophelis]HAT4009594.1 transposase family protein [Elizabethkingia anophelis]